MAVCVRGPTWRSRQLSAGLASAAVGTWEPERAPAADFDRARVTRSGLRTCWGTLRRPELVCGFLCAAVSPLGEAATNGRQRRTTTGQSLRAHPRESPSMRPLRKEVEWTSSPCRPRNRSRTRTRPRFPLCLPARSRARFRGRGSGHDTPRGRRQNTRRGGLHTRPLPRPRGVPRNRGHPLVQAQVQETLRYRAATRRFSVAQGKFLPGQSVVQQSQ